jgi:copper chaperone CopZ
MMIRRRFMQGIACSLGGVEAAASGSKTVTYRIEGFSCVTCAVGLDAMLKERKGIVRSKSSYEERTAVVEFNPGLVSEKQIRGFIEELGFTARNG